MTIVTCRSCLYANGIGTTELVAAAANKQFRAKVMDILYMQPEIFITKPVIAATIHNTRYRPNILQLHIFRPDRRVKKLVIELVVTAIALYIGCGKALYDDIEGHRNQEIDELTKVTVTRYAENGTSARDDIPTSHREQLIIATVHAENIAALWFPL